MGQRFFLGEGEKEMRWLMWFTIGFTVACAAGVYLQTGLLPVFFIAIAIPLFFLRSRTARCAAIALVGLIVGTAWLYGYDALYLNAARAYDGQTVSVTAVVADYSFDTQFGIAADADVELDGKQFRVRMYMSGEESLSPGDTVTGDLRFRLTTSDSIQGSTYHQGDGIFLLTYAYNDLEIQRTESVPVKYYPAVLRKQITDLIDRSFPGDTVAFARALLLGDSSLLSYEEDTAFKISGIRHIIAVSGLHVSILMSFVYLFAGRRRVMSAVLGIPILFLFAAVAGFTPSVVRACIMQALVLLALLFDKEYDPPTALSFAVLTMLCVNPQTITSVSFQLSAGCLVGIFLFYQRIYQYLCAKLHAQKGKTMLKRILRWACSSVAISLSAMAATTPLSAWYFGTISLSGILTNVLTLWVVSFIFYGIGAVCVVGVFWQAGASASCVDSIMADPLCTTYGKAVIRLSIFGSIYLQYLCSAVAGSFVCPACCVSLVEEEKAGDHDRVCNCRIGCCTVSIVFGTEIGQFPRDCFGRRTGAINSDSK